MFDIGLWELIVIGVVGLIVLGPERLPVAVRSVSQWIRTAKKMASNVKDELAQELEIDKLHADLKRAESYSKDLNTNLIPDELHESIKSLQQAAQDVTRPYERSSNKVVNSDTAQDKD